MSFARQTRRTVLFAAAWLAVGMAGCGPETAPTMPAGAGEDGAALYGRFCAVCHGADGVSVPETHAPRLRSDALLAIADDRFLTRTIALGRPGANGGDRRGTKMTAFGAEVGGPLGEAEIDRIVAHLRGWQTVPAETLPEYTAAGDPATGGEIYTARCASCHGTDGWGTEAPRLAGATFQQTASDAFIRRTILGGRPGTAMVAFDLSEAEVANLVAFIRTLDDGG